MRTVAASIHARPRGDSPRRRPPHHGVHGTEKCAGPAPLRAPELRLGRRRRGHPRTLDLPVRPRSLTTSSSAALRNFGESAVVAVVSCASREGGHGGCGLGMTSGWRRHCGSGSLSGSTYPRRDRTGILSGRRPTGAFDGDGSDCAVAYVVELTRRRGRGAPCTRRSRVGRIAGIARRRRAVAAGGDQVARLARSPASGAPRHARGRSHQRGVGLIRRGGGAVPARGGCASGGRRRHSAAWC